MEEVDFNDVHVTRVRIYHDENMALTVTFHGWTGWTSCSITAQFSRTVEGIRAWLNCKNTKTVGVTHKDGSVIELCEFK